MNKKNIVFIFMLIISGKLLCFNQLYAEAHSYTQEQWYYEQGFYDTDDENSGGNSSGSPTNSEGSWENGEESGSDVDKAEQEKNQAESEFIEAVKAKTIIDNLIQAKLKQIEDFKKEHEGNFCILDKEGLQNTFELSNLNRELNDQKRLLKQLEAKTAKKAEQLSEAYATLGNAYVSAGITGDPVRIATGEYICNYSDFSAQDYLNKFSVLRNYKSSNTVSSFGYNWDCSLDSRIIHCGYGDFEGLEECYSLFIDECIQIIDAIDDYNRKFQNYQSFYDVKQNLEQEKFDYQEQQTYLKELKKDWNKIIESNKYVCYGKYSDLRNTIGCDDEIIFIGQEGIEYKCFNEGNGIWRSCGELSNQNFVIYGYSEDLLQIENGNFPEKYVVCYQNGEKYIYSNYGLLEKYIDSFGNETKYYCENGKINKIVLKTGEEITVFRNSSDFITRISGPVSGESTYCYEGNLLSFVCDNEGCKIGFTYDSDNDISSIIKADGSRIDISYCYVSGFDKKMVSAVRNEIGLIEYFDYDFTNKQVVHTSFDGQKEYFKLNDNGNTVYHRIENQEPYVFVYNENGTIRNVTKSGISATYLYDSAFRPIQISFSDGGIQSFEYDLKGNLTKVVDKDGFYNEYSYDLSGNCIFVEYCGNPVSKRTFYDNGLIKSIEENGVKITIGYNCFGSPVFRKFEYEDGLVITEKLDYDQNNRLVKYDDGRSTIIDIVYGQNQQTQIVENCVERQILFDERGNQKKIVEKDMVTGYTKFVEYVYDNVQRLCEIYIDDQLYRKIDYADNNQVSCFCEFEINEKLTDYAYPSGNNYRYGLYTSYEYDENNRCSLEINGNCTILNNDWNTVCFEQKSKTNIFYQNTSFGYKKSIKQDSLDLFEYDYDFQGNLIKIIRPDGSCESRKYSLGGRLIQLDGNNINTKKIQYNKGRTSVFEIDKNNNIAEYSYNDYGLIESYKNFSGETVYYEYDSRQNLKSINYSNYSVVYDYDKNNRESQFKIIDGNGLVVYKRNTDVIDGEHKVVVCEGDKYKTEFNLDGFYNVIDENDNKSFGSFENDLSGSGLISRTETSFEYNPVGVIETDSKGYIVSQNNYDTGDMYYYLDLENNLLTQKNANGDFYKTWFDENKNIVKEQNYSGDIAEYLYDFSGNLVKQIDFEGRQTLLEYTAGPQGFTKTIKYPDGKVASVEYDFLGNVKEIFSKEGNFCYEYDTGGKLIKYKDLSSNILVDYCYDEKGRCIEKKGVSFDIVYEYYSQNDLVKSVSEKNSGLKIEFVYNQNGMEIERCYSNGVCVKNRYDDYGRKVSSETYTSYGLISAAQYISYDNLGRIQSVSDCNGNTQKYVYDDSGRIVKAYYPYTKELCENALNEAVECGLYIKNENPQGENIFLDNGSYQYCWVEEYSYTPFGNVESIKNPFGIICYEYDKEGRLQKKHSLNTECDGIDYSWSKNGNLLSVKSKYFQTQFVYGNLNRPQQIITKDLSTGDISEINYEYDVFGRRISESDNNQVHRYVYDGLTTNLLIDSPLYKNSSAFINYDSTIRAVDDDVLYRYFDTQKYRNYNYSEKSDLPKETCLFVNINDSCASYVFSDENTASGKNYQILIQSIVGHAVTGTFDKNGTYTNQISYDIWGNPITCVQSNEDEIVFSDSKKILNTSVKMYDIGFRDYCPSMKSFTTSDISRSGENWYAYCSCDPVNFTDSMGFYKRGLTKAEQARYASGVVSCGRFNLEEAKQNGVSASIYDVFDCADVSMNIDKIAAESAGIINYSSLATHFARDVNNNNITSAKNDVQAASFFNEGNTDSFRKVDDVSSIRDLRFSQNLSPGTVLVWENTSNNTSWTAHTTTLLAIDYDDNGNPIGAVYMEGHKGGSKTEIGYMSFMGYSTVDEKNRIEYYDVTTWQGKFRGAYEIEASDGFRSDCNK